MRKPHTHRTARAENGFECTGRKRTRRGTSLDNTFRLINLVESEWLMMVTQVSSFTRGAAHGTTHIFAQDGTLLAASGTAATATTQHGQVDDGRQNEEHASLLRMPIQEAATDADEVTLMQGMQGRRLVHMKSEALDAISEVRVYKHFIARDHKPKETKIPRKQKAEGGKEGPKPPKAPPPAHLLKGKEDAIKSVGGLSFPGARFGYSGTPLHAAASNGKENVAKFETETD